MVTTRARNSNQEEVRPEGATVDWSDVDANWMPLPPPPGPDDAASLMPPPSQQPDGAGPSRPPPSGTVRTREELEEELRATQQQLRELQREQQSAGQRTGNRSGRSQQSRRSQETADTAKSRTPSRHTREESATHIPTDFPARTPRQAMPGMQVPPGSAPAAFARAEPTPVFAQTIPAPPIVTYPQVTFAQAPCGGPPPAFQYRQTAAYTDFKTFMSCKPAEFTGGHDPVKCARWLREMELCFETCQCDEHLRVIYAARMFRGAALDWWDTTREAMGSAAVAELNWARFKDRVKNGFCTELDLEKLEEDFRSLAMGDRSVSEYTRIFMEKLRFVGHLVPTEAEKINRYCKGLLPKYRGMCRHMLTLDAAILEARRLEEDSKAEKIDNRNLAGEKRKGCESSEIKKESKNNESGSHKKFSTGEKKDAMSSGSFCEACKSRHSGLCSGDTRRCLRCGKTGHLISECKSEVKCFNCQKFGHISTTCPEPRKERKDKTKSQGE